MDMAQGAPKKPFKGLHYYEEEDRDIFFGRSREARELFNLVELNPLTLVFGKSGIGKTSLVNAGLAPLLRQKSFLPVRIRLDYAAGGLPLVSQIKKEMAVQWAALGITATPRPGILTPQIHGEEVSLWQFFRAVDFLCPGAGATPMAVTPMLILDQFEEFFTLG